MSIYDFKWSADEKKVARIAFDKAYQREMEEIKNALTEKVKELQNEKDVWALHDYLTERRKLVDRKYDYRYSQLILVFSQLIREGNLSIIELSDLTDDKIELIMKLSSNE